MKLEPVVVTLKPGQALRVELFETDGAFEIHYDTPAYKGCLVVKEAEGLPDSYGKTGVLYSEVFSAASADTATYIPELDDVATKVITFAVYSNLREVWWDNIANIWVTPRNTNCEFEDEAEATCCAESRLHNFDTSEQIVVVRSDEEVW